jgi:Dolichyl-phosphate-mannose-protein mannosyltransferase
VLVLMGLVALGVGIATLSLAYIDFGDGNYLYIAWRMSEGATLYSDILSPQPPLHLHLGAALVWVGERLGSAVLTVRFALVLIHILTGWLIYRLARAWDFGRGTALLGVGIWATCPIGYRWSIGWQSENIEIPLMLAAQILLMRGKRWPLLLSGLAGAGALLCNMTAAPYVLFNALFGILLFRWRGLLCAMGLAAGWGLVALLFEMRTGAFFQNVILNQVGTYPSDYPGGLLAYFAHKLTREGRNVLRAEGLWVLLAIMGLFWAAALRRPMTLRSFYIGLYSLGGLLSITYVTKGGTVDYIFCLGEPFVGIWAAWSLMEGARALNRWARGWGTMLAVAIFLLGCWQVRPYLWRYLSQAGFEWPENRMALVVEQIETHSEPGDLILAPPHFAFITQRRLVEEFSSTYLWYTKWRLRDPEGQAMMERIGAAIAEGRVALVAINGFSLDIVNATARGASVPADFGARENRYIAQITPIRQAVLGHCTRIGPHLQSNLLHSASDAFPGVIYSQEDLTFWIPRDAESVSDD